MQAEYVKDTESDLMIINAARVSLHKHHYIYDEETDTKLINYLARKNHWTPFAHSSLYFHIIFNSVSEELHFLRNISSGGRDFIADKGEMRIRGSLYFWINNYKHLPIYMQAVILAELQTAYPVTFEAFKLSLINEDRIYRPSDVNSYFIKYSKDEILNSPKWAKLVSHTLRVKVPLAIARQIRTSHVGISYSDSDSLLEEGEVFVYNEISRRYVSDEPEMYFVTKFRLREGNRVKQGSTGYAEEKLNIELEDLQLDTYSTCLDTYGDMITENVSPEQARFYLPQGMYTEFYMTACSRRWKEFLILRLKDDVQEETREIVQMMARELRDFLPLA